MCSDMRKKYIDNRRPVIILIIGIMPSLLELGQEVVLVANVGPINEPECDTPAVYTHIYIYIYVYVDMSRTAVSEPNTTLTWKEGMEVRFLIIRSAY